jgi:hypothetical protein
VIRPASARYAGDAVVARPRSLVRRFTLVLALVLLVGAPAEAERQPGWDVRVAERVEVAAGQVAPLAIALAVDHGLTVSKDAAVIIDLAPDAGLIVKKKRLGRGDAVDPEADAPRFAVNVRGDAPGEHVVRLHVRFWLCGTRSCWPIDVRRTATIVVAGATVSNNAGF